MSSNTEASYYIGYLLKKVSHLLTSSLCELLLCCLLLTYWYMVQNIMCVGDLTLKSFSYGLFGVASILAIAV